MCHQEKKSKATRYLKWTRQIVWTAKKCMKMVPHITKGYFCAIGDQQEGSKYGYAAV